MFEYHERLVKGKSLTKLTFLDESVAADRCLSLQCQNLSKQGGGASHGSAHMKLLLSASQKSAKRWKIYQTDEPSPYHPDKTILEIPKNGRKKGRETKLATEFKREFLQLEASQGVLQLNMRA